MCRPSVGIPSPCRNPLAVVTGTEVAAVPRGIGQNVLAALRRNPLGRRHRVGVLDGGRHAAFWYGGG